MTTSCCWFVPVFHSLYKDLSTNHKLLETEYIIVGAVIVIIVFTISDQYIYIYIYIYIYN